MKAFKPLMFIIFTFGLIFVFYLPSEAASLFHKEDFEDNNKMDTFGADSSERLNCLLNSSWIVSNSYTSHGTTVRAVRGNHFLAGNWKSGARDSYGNSSACNNNRLRLLNNAHSGGTGLGYASHIQSEFLIRYYVRVTGPMPMTGYNAAESYKQSTFKLMYMYPGNTCIQVHPSELIDRGAWDTYSQATSAVYTRDPRPPLRDHNWHKIEIYVRLGSSGHVTLWCDDVVRWNRNINVSFPSDIGLVYNDGSKGFFSWDAPYFFDELEFYVDTGSGYPNSSLRDGTIGESGNNPNPNPTVVASPTNLRIIE